LLQLAHFGAQPPQTPDYPHPYPPGDWQPEPHRLFKPHMLSPYYRLLFHFYGSQAA
jgi:hypothetical protein